MTHISDGFGYWVSGLTDGEGCFAINCWKRNYGPGDPHGHNPDKCYEGWAPYFQIGMRDDEENTKALERIKHVLGVGSLYVTKAKGKSSQVRFIVRSVSELHNVIIPFFRKYPLKTLKAKQFKVWVKGVEALYDDAKNRHVQYNKRGEKARLICIETKQKLSALRAYQPQMFGYTP